MATCWAAPLLILLVVTTAVRLPALVGFVEKVTVSAVLVAEVTEPTAPLLNVTLLFPAVGSKPKPAIETVAALAASAAMLDVTTGLIVATCTAAPLLKPLLATLAFSAPATIDAGRLELSAVADAAEMVPMPLPAPLKVTPSLSGFALKPKPLIDMLDALAAKEAVFNVTTGITVATCTAPVDPPNTVTFAVRLPTFVGCAEKVTVNCVALAEVTLPVAPLLKTTVLFAGVAEKLEPSMVTVAEVIGRLVMLAVTTGAETTSAT